MAIAAEKELNSSLRKLDSIRERVPTPGVYIVKSAELDGLSGYIDTHLYLHLHLYAAQCAMGIITCHS